ncbi:hypothetical protein G3I24_09655, partial [Micromonospora aurantiaca]|nr:hypothetical protein [Micromonospora aurantiaca]
MADDQAACRGSSELEGQSRWSHGEEGNEIVLCVRRQFRVGQCFLANDGAEEDTVSVSEADLMTSWPCGDGSAPGDYEFVLRITAYTTASSCPP